MSVEHTERYIVVDGRRWRATDPAIPPALRQELVNELMAARRAVGVARRAKDAEAEQAARSRVGDAKVALGERGDPWWEPPTPEALTRRLTAAVLTLARHRGPAKTTCPSDAARAVGGTQWRRAMDPTRAVARDLARDGSIEVTQRGGVLHPDAPWQGPVRIRAVDPK